MIQNFSSLLNFFLKKFSQTFWNTFSKMQKKHLITIPKWMSFTFFQFNRFLDNNFWWHYVCLHILYSTHYNFSVNSNGKHLILKMSTLHVRTYLQCWKQLLQRPPLDVTCVTVQTTPQLEHAPPSPCTHIHNNHTPRPLYKGFFVEG